MNPVRRAARSRPSNYAVADWIGEEERGKEAVNNRLANTESLIVLPVAVAKEAVSCWNPRGRRQLVDNKSRMLTGTSLPDLNTG